MDQQFTAEQWKWAEAPALDAICEASGSDALDYRVPPWCQVRQVRRNINELLRYSFHKKSGLPEHHALYDAQADRYAFRERPLATR